MGGFSSVCFAEIQWSRLAHQLGGFPGRRIQALLDVIFAGCYWEDFRSGRRRYQPGDVDHRAMPPPCDLDYAHGADPSAHQATAYSRDSRSSWQAIAILEFTSSST
jgi:hypothetical protein